MTEVKILFELLILFFSLLPGLYFVFLTVFNPWSREKKHRKLHELGGNSWMSTEEGGIGADTDNWILYIYKWDE